jgi:hypothetical protein
MNRVTGVLAALLVGGMSGVGQGWAQAVAADESAEKGWEVTVRAEAAEIYLFRGLDLLAGEPVATASVSAAFAGGFSAYYFGYLGDLGEGGERYREDDFGVDYTFAVGKMSLTLGGVGYRSREPRAFEDTTELYAIAAFDTLLSPKISYWNDVDLLDAGYVQLAVAHTWEMGHGVRVVPSAALGISLGWTEKTFGKQRAQQANDFLVGVYVPWQVNDAVAVHLLFQQSFALDALEDVGQGDENTWVVGGSYTF